MIYIFNTKCNTPHPSFINVHHLQLHFHACCALHRCTSHLKCTSDLILTIFPYTLIIKLTSYYSSIHIRPHLTQTPYNMPSIPHVPQLTHSTHIVASSCQHIGVYLPSISHFFLTSITPYLRTFCRNALWEQRAQRNIQVPPHTTSSHARSPAISAGEHHLRAIVYFTPHHPPFHAWLSDSHTASVMLCCIQNDPARDYSRKLDNSIKQDRKQMQNDVKLLLLGMAPPLSSFLLFYSFPPFSNWVYRDGGIGKKHDSKTNENHTLERLFAVREIGLQGRDSQQHPLLHANHYRTVLVPLRWPVTWQY